jgi:hypothetical protein
VCSSDLGRYAQKGFGKDYQRRKQDESVDKRKKQMLKYAVVVLGIAR